MKSVKNYMGYFPKRLSAYLVLYGIFFMVTLIFQASFVKAAESDFEIIEGVLTAYHGSEDHVVIPDTVTVIGDHTFLFSTMSRVTVPESVTDIGAGAFKGCAALNNVIIPEACTAIGEEAFKDCSSLEHIILPGTVTRIGSDAFTGTPWLITQQKDNPLVTVNDILIDGTACSGKIIIPDGVTCIADSAFCRKITTDAGYTYTGSSITEVTVPETVSAIGYGAFRYCDRLTAITLPKSLTYLGSEAFRHCTSLKSIQLPDGLKSVEPQTFSDCIALSALRLPACADSIGQNAFYHCSSVKAVRIPSSVNTIETRHLLVVPACPT